MDNEPSDLRISDSEREDAIGKLGEHMSTGRLGIDEYGERTAQVAAARTRGEVLALFADLPEPRPRFGAAVQATRPAQRAQPAVAPSTDGDRPLPPLNQRLVGALVPFSAILAVVLFFTVAHTWLIFLMPAAVAMVGGALWGDDWRGDRHGRRMDRRIDRLDRRRELDH